MEIIYKNCNKYKNAKAFLFGLKGYSTLEEEIALEDIASISGKVFLAIDKNIMNSSLDDLEKILSSVDNYNISGIFFYDLSVLSICKRLGVKTPLIWNQNYLVTNYKTCNFYEKEGVSGAVINPIITISEIVDICGKTKFDILVPVFGYQMMALSNRKLITNYFDYIGESNFDKFNMIREKDKKYPVLEADCGTKIYSDEILNGIKYINRLKRAGVKYVILDGFLIEPSICEKVFKYYERAVYEDLGDEELLNLEKEIKELIPGSSTLFFNKKTVFKVKKND